MYSRIVIIKKLDYISYEHLRLYYFAMYSLIRALRSSRSLIDVRWRCHTRFHSQDNFRKILILKNAKFFSPIEAKTAKVSWVACGHPDCTNHSSRSPLRVFSEVASSTAGYDRSFLVVVCQSQFVISGYHLRAEKYSLWFEEVPSNAKALLYC